jgi:hypothetical protein
MNDTLTFGAISDEETHFYIPDNSTVVIQVEGTVTLAANSGYGVGPYAGGGGTSRLPDRWCHRRALFGAGIQVRI